MRTGLTSSQGRAVPTAHIERRFGCGRGTSLRMSNLLMCLGWFRCVSFVEERWPGSEQRLSTTLNASTDQARQSAPKCPGLAPEEGVSGECLFDLCSVHIHDSEVWNSVVQMKRHKGNKEQEKADQRRQRMQDAGRNVRMRQRHKRHLPKMRSQPVSSQG